MKRLTLDSPELKSADLVAENIERLKELFPEAFANEGKIDFDVLRQLLGDRVDDGEERYGLNWHGKRAARQLALTPSTGTLRPFPEESVDWDTTQNIFIEGDNLEVLKLLQKSYAGKVKLIYIDPPYNTGKDFVYPDNFQDSIKNYLDLTGQIEGGQRITSNTEASGRFHTDWLNMMYPRIKVAQTLLGPTGAVFVSCDDNELPRLLQMMDELFGEDNFVAVVVWQRSKKGDAKLIANVHEYIVCYTRDKAATINSGLWRRPKDGAAEVLSRYSAACKEHANDHAAIRTAMMAWYRSLADDDPRKAHKHYNWSDDRGLYFAADFAGPDDGRESRPRHDIFHPVTGKPCKKPSTGWRWDPEKTAWALAQVPPRIHFGEDETTIPTRKSYLFEIDSEPYSSVFYRDGRSATLEVEGLIGPGWFQFPKNTDVLEEIATLASGPNDLILDFFAGSGSTAHAVFKANQRTGAQRRWIAIQLPEPTGRNEFKTIANIAIRRIAEASKQIRSAGTEGDYGFRVFRLDSGNVRPWEASRETLAEALKAAVDHVKSDRTEDDLLYDMIIKHGIDLCAAIDEKQIGDHKVRSVGGGAVFACFGSRITAADVEQLADGIAKWRDDLAPANPELSRVVFRDSAFESDVAKTNLALILKERGFDEKLVVSL
jgi:adenine-specific DNA-methyltransferase